MGAVFLGRAHREFVAEMWGTPRGKEKMEMEIKSLNVYSSDSKGRKEASGKT